MKVNRIKIFEDITENLRTNEMLVVKPIRLKSLTAWIWEV